MTTATVQETSPTDIVLYQMLTENTGRHFLDSGGAYGRNWERNQGTTIQDWMNRPAAWFNLGGWVTLDVFHWLRERLEYSPEWDRKFQLYTSLFIEESTVWLECAEIFADKVRRKYLDGHEYLNGTYNSYNHESSLSQTIQFVMVNVDSSTTLVLLQIHGGCDIRGGYTTPRAFLLFCDEGDMLDFDNYTLTCTRDLNPDTPLPGMPMVDDQAHTLDHRGDEFTSIEGEYFRNPWRELGKFSEDVVKPEDGGAPYLLCPHCGAPMQVWPGIVS